MSRSERDGKTNPVDPEATEDAALTDSLAPSTSQMSVDHLYLETRTFDGAEPTAPTEAASAAGRADATTAGLSGTRVGRYLLLEAMGQGGMGVVYKAYDPELHRRVAIKLMRKLTAAAQARLVREGQAIAQLHHPNVIAVHDVGTFEGQVFLAMEFFDGRTLRKWLKERPRSWREILSVYCAAAAGLAAAHAAGLIHRDFKPDNVLVDDDAEVRVLDFGLARAITRSDEPPTSASTPMTDPGPLARQLTATGAMMGTPGYMSPEQLEGAAVDERTDQFAFCVALYEALYGERPFENGAWTLREAPRGRRVPAWVRRPLVRGLQRDPAQRFASMQALLAELGKDPAIVRGRVLRASAATMVVLLVAAGVYRVTQQRTHLCQSEDRALGGIWDANAQARLQDAFLRSGKPQALDTWTRVRAQLDGYAQSIVALRTQACTDTRVKGSQSDEALSLRMECLDRRLTDLRALTQLFATGDAGVLDKAVDAASALTPLETCNDVSALRAPLRPPATREARARVDALRDRLAEASALTSAGQYARALAVLLPAVAEARHLGYRPLEAELLTALGLAQDRSGKLEQAAQTLREALLAAEAGRHYEMAALAGSRLVATEHSAGRASEAGFWVAYTRAVIESLGKRDLIEADLLDTEAAMAGDEGRRDEAVAFDERALALREAALGPEHPKVGISQNNLGIDFAKKSDYPRAIAHLERALAILEKVFGPDHVTLAYPLHDLGFAVLTVQGPSDEAERYIRRSLVLREARMGRDYWLCGDSLQELGLVYIARGEYARAEAELNRAVAILQKSVPEGPLTAQALDTLGVALTHAGKYEAALTVERQALELWQHIAAPEYVASVRQHLGLTLQAMGQQREALAMLQSAVAALAKTPGPETLEYADAIEDLGLWQLRNGHVRDALVEVRHALALKEQLSPPDAPALAETHLAVGLTALAANERSEAIAALLAAEKLLSTKRLAPELLGEARFGLARASSDEASARAWALQAKSDVTRSEAPDKSIRLRAIDDWMSRHPARVAMVPHRD